LSRSAYESIDLPIFIPAKKRVRFPIHVRLSYPPQSKPNPTLEERKQFIAGLEKYVTDEFQNLDGFDLLDDVNRYEIVFDSGWKKKQ
jgi:hypothetical protein